MKRAIEDLYKKYSHFHDKLNDSELDDYLLSVVRKLEDADTMYHQLGYLVMHIKATVVYQARPPHLRDAIDRAERFLGRHAEDDKAGDQGSD
jgi:hypothetical protein